MSNQEVKFIIPAVASCSDNTYTISVNGQSAAIPFTYDNSNSPSISSLSLTSSSPILKKTLVITGLNLGSLSTTSIFLYNAAG